MVRVAGAWDGMELFDSQWRTIMWRRVNMTDESGKRRRSSPTGAIVLIVIGVILLMAHFVPNMDPWPLFARYWPLILIFVGLGGLIDYLWASAHREQQPRSLGVMTALLILTLLFLVALWRHPATRQENHMSRQLDAQGAQSVRTHIEMPAGTLFISSGATDLFDGDFEYSGTSTVPEVTYNVAGGHGDLDVSAKNSNVHFAGPSDDTWDLRLNAAMPTELKVEMGAGTGNLRLNDLNLSGLEVNLGVGTLNLDLDGEWKQSFHGDIQGGVGTATVKLPKDVGVRVHAEGGIGSVNAHGLKRDGGEYVNEALGKSPVTLDLNVHGGVGTINLDEEP
jgi:hypothetical protein